jgi:hypothetical protein
VFVDRVVELAASTTVNVFAQRGHLAAGFFGHGSSSLVSVGAITPLIVPWGALLACKKRHGIVGPKDEDGAAVLHQACAG